MIGPALAEMYIEMKEPTRKRRIRMEFALVYASGKITCAEDVDERRPKVVIDRLCLLGIQTRYNDRHRS